MVDGSEGRSRTATRHVAASADPARVEVVLERLGAEVVDGLDRRTRDAIVAVAAASDSLGDLVAEDPRAIDTLVLLDEMPSHDATDAATLQVEHRLGLLRVAARDLLGIDDLSATVERLTALTTQTIEVGLRLAGADSLVVVGMGKYGAGELNFVSDVDLLLVSEVDPEAAERSGRRFLDAVRGCFRVDTALRPGGRDGALVRSVDGYRAHWDRWADAWEFQALLKAVSVAGPAEVRDAFDAATADALWSRPLDRDDLHQIRRMKARAEAEVHRAGLSDREVKRAPGGIRDIEFSVQLLQLVHGGADPGLRTPSTLLALDQLVAGGYVDADEAATLRNAYRFLRTVEHRLQLANERQTHTIPDDRDQRRRIARTMGYRGGTDAGPTERFDQDVAEHRLAVRRVHEGWYFRPLLDAFAGVGAVTEEVATARLAAFGFRDAARTRQAVAELSRGLTRSSRLMRQLLPLILDWLSEGPDPDLGLLGLRRLVTGEQRIMRIVAAFRDSAETARALCDLLATAPIATDLLEASPDLVERLDDADRLRTAALDDLLASAWRSVGWRDDPDDQQQSLRRWYRRHLLGIVARDVAGVSDADEVGDDLSALTEAVIETAQRLVDPQVPMAVVGMGRLGGRTLSYPSDVDLVFVHDGDDGRGDAERAATAMLRLLRGPTPPARIVAVDVDLRPEGKQGPLSRSVDSYAAYLDRWARVWERQALLRARPIAGDVEVGQRFAAVADQAAWHRPPTDDDRREIRRIKARIEAERVPPGIEPWRHYKLGPGALADVEWTVQLLQWEAGIDGRGTLRSLERLVDEGVVGAEDAVVLDDAHRWCDRLRNRTWLTTGGQGDAVPEATEPLGVLARSLDTGTATLIEDHRRRLRRARRVVDRLFYDRS
ncbi:MAG: bifunctional [glutamine synthetase] adenylyltransferase/[glutamine synthetase]-adenylyl-L-tyrosine phosphorylase [Acidimicrobiales bacterium]|nr:bifunctional [glutamine synthetase] adenylyltransferase/[glutamine synthetase]-adenylyl-L-tyrosine phosphorylase [Acidimicrobiales bacterium]